MVVDGALVTSRKLDDLPAFNERLEVFAQGAAGMRIRAETALT